MNLKNLERYLRINLFGPGPRLMKKRIYLAAVPQGLRNTGPEDALKCQDRLAQLVVLPCQKRKRQDV